YLTWAALQGRIPTFGQWSTTGAGLFAYTAFYYAANLLTMLYFARVNSLKQAFKALGLQSPPSSYVWFAVVAALALSVEEHLILSHGLSRGVRSPSLWSFKHSVGAEQLLYLAPMVFMAPFCEELYMRGFLYRAFRGTYPVAVSMGLGIATAIV